MDTAGLEAASDLYPRQCLSLYVLLRAVTSLVPLPLSSKDLTFTICPKQDQCAMVVRTQRSQRLSCLSCTLTGSTMTMATLRGV